MGKNTSVSLGEHFENFMNEQVQRGRYGSASEVIRSGLRLLEEHERKVEALQQAITKGIESGHAGELDMEDIITKGKARRGQRSKKQAGNA